jgi:hypothetical protein
MTQIRALVEDDLSAVGALLDRLLPDWGGDPAFLGATVLAHPWADPELSSLVAVGESGALIGFIGAQARRIRFDGAELRGVCCSHLVVDPEHRGGAAGALLLGRLLSGPQAITWSDSANQTVARMWRTFGGQLDHARACDWMLVLRPLGWIGSWLDSAAHRRRIDREVIPVGAFPFHTVARRDAQALEPGVTGEDVGSDQILEHLPALVSRTRLRVDYDEAHLEHLFALIRSRAGELVCRLVRRADRPIGWYAYLPRRSTASRVLHVCAPERQIDAVLGELVDHARNRDSRVLAGRLEPHLDGALRRRLAAVGLAREPVLHAKDPELRAVLSTGSALLTQLDSEWFVT